MKKKEREKKTMFYEKYKLKHKRDTSDVTLDKMSQRKNSYFAIAYR